MSETNEEKPLHEPADKPVDSSPAELKEDAAPQLPAVTQSAAAASGTSVIETQDSAAGQFPITDKADKVNPPLTMEEKKKVWVRRIVGAIVFFSVLGSLALLAAAQAVTFLFKQILPP